jgi:hypothetical protein
MTRIAATIITVLVLAQAASVHAGPSAFDAAPRLVESTRALSADGAQAVSIPTRVSAQAVTSQIMGVTGSLRVTLNGFDPLVFPVVVPATGPLSVLVARDMPGSLPQSFILPAGAVDGTKTVAPTATGGLVDEVKMSGVLGTAFVAASGGPYGGVGGPAPLLGTADLSVLGGLLHLFFPLSPIGDPGVTKVTVTAATLVNQVIAPGWWTTGVTTASSVTPSGSEFTIATGSRGANSISLVTAFMFKSNAAGSTPGVARLNLNFQPLGPTTTTTTTTTLPPPLCGGAPLGGCKGSLAGKSQLQIKLKASDPSKNQLKFKYNKGAATSDTEFGDPVGGSPNFSLCIWDEGVTPQPLLEARVGSGGQCGTKPKPCWKSKPGKSHQYKNKGGNGDGVEQVKIKADGAPDKTQIQVKLKGSSFAAPALPLTTTVTAQFIVDDGGISCWEVPLSTAKKNDAAQFKAKGD